jgi:hypothetical protein
VDWPTHIDAGSLILRPFMVIENESYRLYQKVVS